MTTTTSFPRSRATFAVAFALLLPAGCDDSDEVAAATQSLGDDTQACDLSMQNCPDGQKCVPEMIAGSVPGSGVCSANGTVAEGAACVLDTTNPNAWVDNCVAGTLCDNDGPDNAFTCRKICASDDSCTTPGEQCADLFTTQWGFCLASCTPYGSDCPAGNNCGVAFNDVSTTPTNVTGFFVCKAPGAGTLFAPCTGLDTDCGPDLVCDGVRLRCTPICDSAHACPDAPPTDDGGAGVACHVFTNFSDGRGVCE
jgi:hypothetical protein